MRGLCVLLMWCSTQILAAETVWFGEKSAPRELLIHSTLDMSSFRPMLNRFSNLHPDIRIGYVDINTLELYYRTVSEINDPKASLNFKQCHGFAVKTGE